MRLWMRWSLINQKQNWTGSTSLCLIMSKMKKHCLKNQNQKQIQTTIWWWDKLWGFQRGEVWSTRIKVTAPHSLSLDRNWLLVHFSGDFGLDFKCWECWHEIQLSPYIIYSNNTEKSSLHPASVVPTDWAELKGGKRLLLIDYLFALSVWEAEWKLWCPDIIQFAEY